MSPITPMSRQVGMGFRLRLYYDPQSVPEAKLTIMHRIDALHLDYPFAGSRMLRDLSRGEGFITGRETVRA